jgi:hypothetical protein
MAEVEAAAPVPDPEVPEAPIVEDDKFKKAPKRLPKPSKAEYESKTNALHQTIKERKERINVIMDTIRSKRTNTESKALKDLRTEMNELRAQWNAELVGASLFICFGSSAWPTSPLVFISETGIFRKVSMMTCMI